MAETLFTTNECSWAQVSLNILGMKVTGLRGFEVNLEIEKEHLYASGNNPIDIVSGNKKPDGSLKLLKYEVDKLNDAAVAAGYKNILEVPHALISADIQYKKYDTSKTRFLTVMGIAFTKMSFAMEQGAKFSECTLPFLAMTIDLK